MSINFSEYAVNNGSGDVNNGYIASPLFSAASPGVTQMAWFKTAYAGIIMARNNNLTGDASSYDRHMGITNGGNLCFGLWTGAETIVSSPGAYNDNKWHHGAVSVGPSGTKIYVDGILVNSTGNTGFENSGGYYKAGWGYCTWAAAPTYIKFRGSLEDIRVYQNTQLSDAQVKHIALAWGQDNFTEGLALRWLTTGNVNTTPSTIIDFSGNGNNGTAYNTGVMKFGEQVVSYNRRKRYS